MNLYLSQQQNHLLLLLHHVSLPLRHVGHGPGLVVLPPVRLLPGLALLDQLQLGLGGLHVHVPRNLSVASDPGHLENRI